MYCRINLVGVHWLLLQMSHASVDILRFLHWCSLMMLFCRTGSAYHQEVFGDIQCSNCASQFGDPCNITLHVSCPYLALRTTENDKTAGRAMDCKGAHFLRIDDDRTKTGLNVTFKLPYGYSDYLTGLTIKLKAIDGGDTNREWCHKIEFSKLNSIDPDEAMERIFFFDCMYPVETNHHDAFIISMPVNEDRNNYCKVSHGDITIASANPSLPLTPDRWSPNVSLKQMAPCYIVRLTFNRENTGPEKFNFTKFAITLKLLPQEYRFTKDLTIVRGSHGVIPLYNRTNWKDMDMIQNDGDEVNLDIDVTGWLKYTDKYMILVKPIGPIDGSISASDPVNVTSSPTRGPDSQAISDPASQPSSKVGAWVAIVAGGFLGILIMGFVIVRIFRLRQPRKMVWKDDRDERIMNCCRNTKPGGEEECLFIFPNSKTEKLPPVRGLVVREIQELRSKKKLLLVFSYDRPEHADVVYRLRIYLMYKCGCDVSWTLSVPETEAYHWEGWLLQQLDMADRVLVVNSEPAYWKYTTSKRNQRCDTADGDMFLKAIDLIKTKSLYNASSESCNKFYMVSFPYTSCAHLIPELKDKLRTFQLMQDIGSLFMAIHGLPEDHPNQRTYGKGINDKDYIKCAEGLELSMAIENAEATSKSQQDVTNSMTISSWPSQCSSCSFEDIWTQKNDQFLSW